MCSLKRQSVSRGCRGQCGGGENDSLHTYFNVLIVLTVRQALGYNYSKFRFIDSSLNASVFVCLVFSQPPIPLTFFARSQQQLPHYVATVMIFTPPTLSLSAEETSRRQQNPTGDPHLSSLFSCNHGPRRHRRAPGAPSPSPRWVHVARWPRTPGKSPVCCSSCASDCSSLMIRVSDWGVVGRARSVREHRACRQKRCSVESLWTSPAWARRSQSNWICSAVKCARRSIDIILLLLRITPEYITDTLTLKKSIQ